MGCDIHMRAEVLTETGWKMVSDTFTNDYYDSKRPIDTYNKPKTYEPYGGRNYDLFAMLADVRNGRGFAGVKTSEGFNPISDPKGVPLDASAEVLDFMDSYGCDGHSHSYLTLSELLAYDFDQITVKRGVIELAKYAELRKTNKSPESWSGGISGPNIVTIDEDVADEILDNGQDVGSNRFYVSYHWVIKYKESVSDFIETTIPELQKLGEPDNVRIVFFFDN